MAIGAVELGEGKGSSTSKAGVKRGVAALDFILRLVAFVGTLGSAIMMATTNETLPFVTQFIRFRAEYNDLPTFTVFRGCKWCRQHLSASIAPTLNLPHSEEQRKEQ
ncbi:Casparian strip membrane protein 6 [Linum perenne]